MPATKSTNNLVGANDDSPKVGIKRIDEINKDIGGATAVTYAVPALPK